MSDEFLFVEKYRPKTVDECILPDRIKTTLNGMVAKGELPNIILSGPPGCGKTTAARAMCNEVGADVLFINASIDNGIDVLRTKIAQFASTVSLTDAKKVIILDEADYANPQSFQPALRGFIEEFSTNVRFILTCNFKERIIAPLHSRCAVIDFHINNEEKKQLGAEFFSRVIQILKTENIKYDMKAVATLVQKFVPDLRRILTEIQRYSVSGEIDTGILLNLTQDTYTKLYDILKKKNFTELRKWVSANADNDPTAFFDTMYRNLDAAVDTSRPELAIILGEWQAKSAIVANQEINTLGCLTTIMGTCKF